MPTCPLLSEELLLKMSLAHIDAFHLSISAAITAFLFAQFWWSDFLLRAHLWIQKKIFGDKKAYLLPPGGMGFVFLGDLPFILLQRGPDKIGSFRTQRAAQYGEICCVSIPPLGRRGILVSGPKAAQWFFSKYGRGLEPSGLQASRNLFGESSFSFVSPRRHKTLRKTLLPLFQKKQVIKCSETVSSIVRSHYQQHFPTRSCGEKRVLVYHHFQQIFFKSITTYLLGQDLGLSAEEAQRNLNVMTEGMVMPTFRFPGNPYVRAMAAREKIKRAIKDIIRQRKLSTSHNKHDVVSLLLQNKDDFTDDDICDVVISAFLGGTTASTLSFMIRFLNDRPDILAKIRDEHLSLFKIKGDKAITLEDVEELPHTNQAFLETMRLSPPIPLLCREVTKDMTYENYLIPKGYKVWIDMETLHCNPSNFPKETESFNPDRFSGQSIKSALAKPGYMPFGGGVRTCIGYQLGLFQMRIAFHHLITGYKWKVVPDVEGSTDSAPFSRPADGVPIDLVARDDFD